jgi:hypothetical protein
MISEANGAPGFVPIQHFPARMNNGIGARAIYQQHNSHEKGIAPRTILQE